MIWLIQESKHLNIRKYNFNQINMYKLLRDVWEGADL